MRYLAGRPCLCDEHPGFHSAKCELQCHGLQVDQAQLETVLPAPGGAGMVVRGNSVGSRGELAEIDEQNFRARILLKGGEKEWFDYEDICKYAVTRKHEIQMAG